MFYRFVQDVLDAGADGLVAPYSAGVSADHNDGRLWVQLADEFCQRRAIHAWHLIVGDEYVKGPVLKKLQGLFAAARDANIAIF